VRIFYSPVRYHTMCPPGLEDMLRLLSLPQNQTSQYPLVALVPSHSSARWMEKYFIYNNNYCCKFPRSSFALSHGIYYGKATPRIVLSYFYSARSSGGCLELFHFINSCRIIGHISHFSILFFFPYSKLPGVLFIELPCLPLEMLPRRSMPAYRGRRLGESSAFKDRAT
jgi:hypothetical protein